MDKSELKFRISAALAILVIIVCIAGTIFLQSRLRSSMSRSVNSAAYSEMTDGEATTEDGE